MKGFTYNVALKLVSNLKCVKFKFDTAADMVSCLSKCIFCPHHGLLEVIGLNAAYEKGLACS